MASFVAGTECGGCVGGRVRDQEGFRGTIKYIGPVKTAKSTNEEDNNWYGIEWDQVERGKHDGSVVDADGNLIKYFDCVHNKSGSFVKPKKITTGRTFEAALRERYVKMDAPLVAPDNIIADAYVTTSKGNQKSIEFVGENKIRKWQQIDVVNKVSIRNDTISCAGNEVIDIASHLIEVDLQDNLLSQWVEVAKLVNQMPLLETILLHGNKMEQITPLIITNLSTNYTNAFSKLRVLALNYCHIQSWSSIQSLEPFFPLLQDLYLAGNNISDLPKISTESDINGFNNLRLLDLSFCQLDDWLQVLQFQFLPNLCELLLDGNNIPNVLSNPIPGTTFNVLQRLSLSSTKLALWNDVDIINTYLNVKQLRLSQIPLFALKGASEVRPIVIGRLRQLSYFNGSVISPRERTDSEKMYLRSIMREINSCSGDNSNIIELHPRYEELKGLYAADLLPMGNSSNNANSNIAADLVTIKFKNISFRSASSSSMEPLVKKLPLSLTVSKLKLMIKQLFNIDPHIQVLSIRPYKDSPPTLLDDDDTTLAYYGTVDNSEIFVNETD